jgi:hypothetical protein
VWVAAALLAVLIARGVDSSTPGVSDTTAAAPTTAPSPAQRSWPGTLGLQVEGLGPDETAWVKRYHEYFVSTLLPVALRTAELDDFDGRIVMTFQHGGLMVTLLQTNFDPAVHTERVRDYPSPYLIYRPLQAYKLHYVLSQWVLCAFGSPPERPPRTLVPALSNAVMFAGLQRAGHPETTLAFQGYMRSGTLVLDVPPTIVNGSRITTVDIADYGGRGAVPLIAIPPPTGPDGKPSSAAPLWSFMQWTP